MRTSWPAAAWSVASRPCTRAAGSAPNSCWPRPPPNPRCARRPCWARAAPPTPAVTPKPPPATTPHCWPTTPAPLRWNRPNACWPRARPTKAWKCLPASPGRCRRAPPGCAPKPRSPAAAQWMPRPRSARCAATRSPTPTRWPHWKSASPPPRSTRPRRPTNCSSAGTPCRSGFAWPRRWPAPSPSAPLPLAWKTPAPTPWPMRWKRTGMNRWPRCSAGCRRAAKANAWAAPKPGWPRTRPAPAC